MIRRDAYKRTERVLMKDKIKMPLEGVDAIKNDVIETLSNYMKVYDMHVCFRSLSNGKMGIVIEGEVDGVTLPYIV